MPHDFEKAAEAKRIAEASTKGTISPESGAKAHGQDPPNEPLTERVTWRRGDKKGRG